jgi:hypothetical protein
VKNALASPRSLAPLAPLALCLALSTVGACGGAGRYGYSREYVFLPEERAYAERADETAVYDEVRRMPDRFEGRVLTWWGQVTQVDRVADGTARVTMQLHAHQERHLCEDETDGSCRVTINERDAGSFSAIVRLTPEDQSGENRVQPLSLLRVYGTLAQGETNGDGGPVLRAQYYRHWPRGQYVTTAAAGAMRR